MTWHLVGHRSELAQPGDYVLLSAGADQTLAYNHEGTVIVSDNVCLHRGARIFQGSYGNAPLKCPYHGFEGAAIQKAQALTAWVGDWLFAGDGYGSLEDQLGELLPVLTGISEKIARRHAFDVMAMPCKPAIALENTLEDLHIATVHPDTFGKLDLRGADFARFGRNSAATYRIGDERTVRGLTALSKHFDAETRPETYFHIFLWPATCISSAGGLTYSVQHYLPNGGFTQFYSRLYSARLRADAPYLGYFFDEAAAFNRTVFAQDAAICSRVGGHGTYLAPAEQRVQWLRDADGR